MRPGLHLMTGATAVTGWVAEFGKAFILGGGADASATGGAGREVCVQVTQKW